MTTTAQPRRALTVPELASTLGVSEETVRTWIKRRVIPSFRIGKRRLIDVRAVDALVSARTLAAIAEPQT